MEAGQVGNDELHIHGELDGQALQAVVTRAVGRRVHRGGSGSVCPHHVQVFVHPGVAERAAPRLQELREGVKAAVATFAAQHGHRLLDVVVVDWLPMPLQEAESLVVHVSYGRHRPEEFADGGDEAPTDPPSARPPPEDLRTTAMPAIRRGDDDARAERAQLLAHSAVPEPDSLDLSVLDSVPEYPDNVLEPAWGCLLDRQSQRFYLRGTVVLGRRDPADLVVAHPTVSSRHALLMCRAPGQCFVHDLQSLNGTEVNGQRADTLTPIHTGDVLGFGNLRLRFEELDL